MTPLTARDPHTLFSPPPPRRTLLSMKDTVIGIVLLLVLGSSSVACAESSKRPDTVEGTLRQYVDLRLGWADWKEYSQFITWPDEPGWDCWWVAKEYSVGQSTKTSARVVIPVTYSRLGLFCADLKFQSKPMNEVIRYELLHRSGGWKVNAPVPDYPYVGWQYLREWLSRIATDEHESAVRREAAHDAARAITEAAVQTQR